MQSAFASLCYFCENHGPRIVFTCQPVRNSKFKRKEVNHSSNDDTTENDLPTPQFCGDLYGGNEVVDEEQRCTACFSLDQGLGLFFNNDDEAEFTFVGTQVPINEKLYQILKQASLRSLSVEVSAPVSNCCQPESSYSPSKSMSHNGSNSVYTTDMERDGVVLFGDDDNWYTLSHTFRLKDAKARGFHRSYSLVIVCMDKLLLLRNYDYLIHGLSALITKLQEMTNSFFALEQENDSDLRLASNMKTTHWLPHQFYPKQYALDTSRSLKVITNHENIFALLHKEMFGLLKMLTSLDKDIVLEGCPTQDMFIVMEIGNSGTVEEKELIAHFSSLKESLIQLKNLRIIQSKMLYQNPNAFSSLVWQVVIGGQVVVRSDSLEAQKAFLFALLQLLPIGCIRLTTNAKQYLHSYKCNFLGCSLSTQIPPELQSEMFLLTLKKEQQQADNDEKMALEDYAFTIDSFPERDEPEKPTIVMRYTQLLLDPLINDSTLESALRAARNEWLNNAKLIFQLRHQREGIDLNRIIRVIKCREQDSPVILFWQKGLSKQYKQNVLNTVSNSSAGDAKQRRQKTTI